MVKKVKNPWEKSSATRRQYETQLRKVGREVGRIIDGHEIRTPDDALRAQESLQKYADLLAPWARKTAVDMLQHADNQDMRSWAAASREIGINLRAEIQGAATGIVFRELLDLEVGLIKSIPLDAGKRVHKLAIEAMINGERSGDIAREIAHSGEVSLSHATLIAVTETSRASTKLTEARALNIGSDGYIWRTSRDGRVRKTHKLLEGKFFPWASPPECDPGVHAHPGCIWRCRCWPEVMIPRKIY